jgi:hypothetical protein
MWCALLRFVSFRSFNAQINAKNVLFEKANSVVAFARLLAKGIPPEGILPTSKGVSVCLKERQKETGTTTKKEVRPLWGSNPRPHG